MKHQLLILLVVTSFTLSGQGFLSVDGQEIVNENGEPYLLKGMGLGGWMLQEGYMLQTAGFANAQHQIRERMVQLMGAQRTQEFYDAWLPELILILCILGDSTQSGCRCTITCSPCL